MSSYVRYTLVSPGGEVQSGEIKSEELESILRLANQGYEILELTEISDPSIQSAKATKAKSPEVPKQAAATEKKKRHSRAHKTRVSQADLKLLTLYLSELMSVGVTLPDALEQMSRSSEGALASVSKQLGNALHTGLPFSKALYSSPYYFDQAFISMIRVGEESGNLTKVLAQLHARAERTESLQRGFFKAAIYPIALIVASILLLAFVSLFVVPSILPVINSISDEVPWPTEVLLYIHSHGWKFTLLFAAAFACLPWLRSSHPTAEAARQWLKFESPLFGPLARTQTFNQFCNDLGLLLNSGISVVKALGLIQLEDEALEQAKKRVVTYIIDGDSLSEAFAREPIFPKLLSVLTNVAEESGADLPKMLMYQAKLLELEAEENRRVLARLFEPILISVMGAIIGFVLMAVFLPIYGQLTSGL